MTTRRDFLGRCATALAVLAGLPPLVRAAEPQGDWTRPPGPQDTFTITPSSAFDVATWDCGFEWEIITGDAKGQRFRPVKRVDSATWTVEWL